MASDSTFLYFQRKSDDSHTPISPHLTTVRINGYRGRDGSVPPTASIRRSRAGSVPPQSTGLSGRIIHTVASLASERAGLLVNHRPLLSVRADSPRTAVRNFRRASIAVPTETKLNPYQATSQCFRAYSPTQSCRPTKIMPISDVRSQSRPSSQAGGTLAIPPYRPVMLNQYRPIPSISSYYRVPNSGENSLLNVRKVSNYRVITAKEDKKYDDIQDNGRPRQFVNKVETEHESLSDLRLRTKAARDKLSHHRVLLDRYLPINMGPANDVNYEVENKYGELLSRMPQLEYKRSLMKENFEDSDSTRQLVAPYKPASRPARLDFPQIQVRNSFTPKISETRKRARSVLCKVKGDPHYFSF